MKVSPFEKMKCDDLHNQILEYKEMFKKLPEYLILNSSRIPDECKQKMSINIDDTQIPIIEVSDKPC